MTGTQRDLSHFRAKFDSPVPPTPGLSYAPRHFVAGPELIMLVPTTHLAAPKIIHTSASAVARDNTAHASYQSAAFYLSVLTGFFPTLLPLAKDSLRECGYNVIEITEDTAAEHFITLQRSTDGPTALAIFAQLALIIYKDIDDRTYARSMQSWAAEIKNEVDVVGELVPGVGDVLLPITTARNIRTIVGSCNRIRAGLLKVILANQDGHSRLNHVCKYLAESIRWTDMEPLKFMFESIYLTDSPVLKDIRVKNEVRNLREAYKRVNEKEYPQYYQILHPTEAGVTIVMSRFETLAEVAERYRSGQHNTVRRFGSSWKDMLVNELLAIHRAFMTSTNASV